MPSTTDMFIPSIFKCIFEVEVQWLMFLNGASGYQESGAVLAVSVGNPYFSHGNDLIPSIQPHR